MIILRQSLSLLLFLLFFVQGCHQEDKTVTNSLVKITEADLIERIKNDRMPEPGSVRLKDQYGHLISLDSLKELELKGYAEDFYLNEDGEIVEVVIRPATRADKQLMARINQALQAGPPLQRIEIDCSEQRALLEQVLRADQDMRTGAGDYQPETDHHNLELVVSLLEQCGMPAGPEFDREHILTVWLVLQHANNSYRRKYLPLLKKAVSRGDLEAAQIATMEDRILMEDGLPQRYGTQLMRNHATGLLELYELEDSAGVDRRRAAVGLEPLGEYLRRFGIVDEPGQE